MHETEPVPAAPADTGEPTSPDTLIEADDLVEEVSIDGMCGVY
ncbi:mycofactocin precursor MftA [Streptomyces sp. NBC_00328]|nr:mycofactocin precursor MftA [Streptomyces sp. NBC_00328]